MGSACGDEQTSPHAKTPRFLQLKTRMQLKLKKLAAAAALLFIGNSYADINSTLTFSDPSAGLGAGPYATVSITQGANAHSVSFTETMMSPYALIDTGGPHYTLAFNIAGSESITISG